MYDVIIVGAGPAGLSAALMLGRSRRRVLVCDTGKPRNAASRAMHGYLTRDGMAPLAFLATAREELRRYDTVEIRDIEVVEASCGGDARFQVALADGSRHHSRKLLIATGVVDHLPEIPGFRELYGCGVFHCPYCDGWEVRDQPLAIYGRGARGLGLSLELTGWSRDLVLCTVGPPEIDAEGVARVRRNGIRVREDRLVRLEGRDTLERLVFDSGDPLSCRALFFHHGTDAAVAAGRHPGVRVQRQGHRPHRQVRVHAPARPLCRR